MSTKTTFAALTAAAVLAPAAASALSVGSSQSFVSSEVVAQADVSTPDFVRASVALGENGQASDSASVDGTFVGAIANLQSLITDNVLHIAGTSNDVRNGSSAAPAFYHEVRTAIDAVTTTIFSVFVAEDVTDAVYDLELLSTLEITDSNGNQVDISAQLAELNADPTARGLEIELGPGAYQTFLGSGSGAGSDREFQLRSTVVAAPTPSAALAGLLGLGGLMARRRKQG